MNRQTIVSYTPATQPSAEGRWNVVFLDTEATPSIVHIRDYICLESALLDAKYWLSHAYPPLGQVEIEELTY